MITINNKEVKNPFAQLIILLGVFIVLAVVFIFIFGLLLPFIFIVIVPACIFLVIVALIATILFPDKVIKRKKK